MAQRTAASGGPLSNDPETIRAEIAKTRAALQQELDQLKRRLFSSREPVPRNKEKKMAKKKTTSGKNKSASSRSSTRSGSKTKKVLGEMLAGAAVGAVKGAAEAALPDKERKEQGKKSAK